MEPRALILSRRRIHDVPRAVADALEAAGHVRLDDDGTALFAVYRPINSAAGRVVAATLAGVC